ncbi:MAG: Fe2+-dependent dioxygenase [Pseudomonadota bacterium]
MMFHLKSVVAADTCAEICSRLATASFIDGAASSTDKEHVIKNSLQLPLRDPIAQEISKSLGDALQQNPAFISAAWPRRMTPPRVNRYDAGMYYREHLDNAIMGGAASPLRTDLAMTICLNDASEYEGGSLVVTIDGETRSWQGDAGDVLVYPAGCLHSVAEVTAGSRLVAVAWIESQIRDGTKRQALYDLDKALDMLVDQGCEREPQLLLKQLRGRLLRMWCEP